MASFGGTLTSLLNAHAVSTALGVASKTGLLNGLSPEPATSAELATRSEMSERYAREILAVLVTGDVVTLHEPNAEVQAKPSDGADSGDLLRYSLAADRVTALAGMGMYFQELPLLSQCAFDEVCIAAKTGAGVPSERYVKFGQWMGELADQKHQAQLVQQFIPALDNGSIEARLRNGTGNCSALDLGCGEGTVVCLLAAAFPSARFVGVDASSASVAAAKSKAETAGLSNVQFLVGDVSSPGFFNELPPEARDGFDLITAFDVIHDLPQPAAALVNTNGLLKPNTGRFAMVDVRAGTGVSANRSHSMAPFLYTVSLLHCMPQGLQDGGAGLGMMWGRQRALAMLKEAGFANSVDVLELEFDTFNDCYLCAKGPN